MDRIAQSFQAMTLQSVAFWCVAVNVGLFVLAILCGEAIVRLYRHRRIAPPADDLSWKEFALSAGCVSLNSLVMFAGVFLLQNGIVEINANATTWNIVFDVAVFVVIMDAAMYVLHRVAHVPSVYRIVHQTHHSYENPRPLTLFVLNPFEVLGFGTLWLVVISVYASTAWGMAIYLGMNLAFGTIGHLGVEPFPRNWSKSWTWWISTSTFHARHHCSPGTNFGFYTLVWDFMFGTLDRSDLD